MPLLDIKTKYRAVTIPTSAAARAQGPCKDRKIISTLASCQLALCHDGTHAPIFMHAGVGVLNIAVKTPAAKMKNILMCLKALHILSAHELVPT